MFIRLFSKWLILLFMFALLNACGGGSDEPSGLLADTGGNVGGDPPPIPAPIDEFTDISVSLAAQQIIPSGGKTTVSLTTYIADADREGEIAPNVTLKITIHPQGAAKLENVPNATDRYGDASFTVSHPGSGNVSINISGTGRFKKGFDIPLYFGATATANIDRSEVPADGQTSANLNVFVRDWTGTAIPAIPVNLSFPLHSFAVPTVTSGDTDETGHFTTGITNTVAQITKVTPIAGGFPTGSLTLSFGASTVVTAPEVIELITKSNNVVANGTTTATLIVIARDVSGMPVRNIPVSISSDSATALLSIEGKEPSKLFISGDTGEKGSFELNITNTVEEEVNIIATTTSGDEDEKTALATVIFTSDVSDSTAVAKIELDKPLNNEQFANGTDKVYLRGRVLDKDGNPLSNQKVSIIIGGSSAEISEEIIETDISGRFSVTFTDEFAEQFTAKAVIGDISSNSVIIKFIAIPIEGEIEVTVQSITLLASPNQQIANGEDQITLTAIVRDMNNTPISGVPVTIGTNSATAIFDKGAAETGEGGTAIFNVRNMVPETFSVTVNTQGRAGTISDSKTVSFVTETLNIATLDVTVVNNNQPANGEEAIKIDVVARDRHGSAISDVPIMVQMSAGTTAFADPSRDNTDSNGFFTTNITSTQAGDIIVTIAVEGISSVKQSKSITFIANSVIDTEVTPSSVDLKILNNGQPADGESKITLIATPRDASGTPLLGVDIELIAESNNIETIPSGTTNALGEYRVTVTSQVAEKFKVTPVATKDTTMITGSAVFLTFIPVDSGSIGFQVNNNNQLADGESAITLVVIFKDASGNPIRDAEVKFIDDSPTVEISGGTTNALGEFRTIVKSTVPEKINVTPVVNDIVGEQKSLIFYADTGTIDFQVNNNNQAADGESAITLVVTFKDSRGNPIPDAEVKFIDDSPTVEISGGTTNALGEFRTIVKSTIPEKINVTPVVKELLGVQKTITFIPMGTAVKDLTVTVVRNNQQATGTETIQIDTVIRDNNGQPVKDVPLIVQLPAGSAAIANPSQGKSDENGYFTTSITSTVAGDVEVTIAVEGSAVASQSKVVTFLAASAVTPTTIELHVFNALQPADNVSAITLVAIPRDAKNAPIADVEIELISDSTTATFANTKGKTNALGEFRTTVTNSVAEIFHVTPVVVGSIKGSPTVVTFLPLGMEVNDLSVSIVENNKLADGQDGVNINVITRDQNGQTVSGVPIVVQIATGEVAIATPSHGNTDDNGVFNTTITSTVAGDVEVTIAIEGTAIVPQSKVVTFLATSAVTPTSVELQVLNAPQPADDVSAITLVAIPRDAKNVPIAGVEVELISDSTTANIAQTKEKTNALGEFRTTVTNSVPETFNVTPVVAGIKGSPTPVTFLPIGMEVNDLNVSIVENNKLADGQDGVNINVVTRDQNGRTVSGVPIVVQIATGEAAIATPSHGDTDDNGFFNTTITSTEAGEVQVTVSIAGTNIAAAPVLAKFIAAQSGASVTSVELIAKNVPQPADGQSLITLVVIPRDARGVPVAGVNVELIKDAKDSDQITIALEAGTTNALGEFSTTVKTTKDLTETLTETLVVNVTPVVKADDKTTIIGDATPIIFIPVAVAMPDKLILNVINNNQETGQEITLSVLARDDKGFPLGNVSLVLSVAPGDEPPDVTGSARFGANGFQGLTENTSGVFETTITNSQPGTFKVTAAVLGKGGVPILNSNTVDVTFKGAPTDVVKEVSSIRLITSSPQLGSEGAIDGVLITAIVKDKNNNLVSDAVVSFRADSGEVQPIQVEGSSALAGVTNESGQAQARLTTIGNADNRTITVTATVPTTTGEIREESLTIEVTGTTIIISGEETVILGSTIDMVIFMKDSAGNGIGLQALTVKSSLGNPIDNLSPVTNANGQATIKLTANIAGKEAITVSKPGVVSSTFVINISNDNFTLKSDPAGVNEIKLNTPQEFIVHWDKGGIPQFLKEINIFSTRGILSANNVETDINGNARFSISANNSGPALITASTTVAGGPSAQISVEFIATEANSMSLQADPVTIGVNTPESEAQQSEIIAVVRDPEHNLVKGKRIDFTLEDVTGGRLFPSSAVTDSFGRANTIYTAGISPSAADGVIVTAKVVDKPAVNNFVNLTVAAKSLFVTLGTGNTVEEDPPVRYKYPYTVLINDANGVAITDAEVILSVLPLRFAKGTHELLEEKWEQIKTVDCKNEDTLSPEPGDRFNGILDCERLDCNQSGGAWTEDINENGTLEPGNVATFDSGDTLKTVETDANGFADFYIVYAKDFAHWVEVRLTATVTVAGSEGKSQRKFVLRGAAADYADKDTPPPGRFSPFGISDSCFDDL
jgi:adhesin/invasin